jgi:hypothetical protein
MSCIKGIMIPAAWDITGNAISLAIATDDEKEYLIDSHQSITELLSLLRQEVIATGTIRLTDNNRVIRVTSIRRK